MTNLGSDDVLITVADNGVGLTQSRFDTFCELDTEFKKERGGKGVGRLYWLDAFKKIEVFHNSLRTAVWKSARLRSNLHAKIKYS